MLGILRLASRSAIGIYRQYTANEASEPCTTQSQTATKFFDLPPELRIAIYELAAVDVVLIIPAKRSKRPSSSTALSLLQVSKQTRQEYLPVLLSAATVVAKVVNYDFRNLTRVLSGLSRNNLAALRQTSHGSNVDGSSRRLHVYLLFSKSAAPTLVDCTSLRSTWMGWLHTWPANANDTSANELARKLHWRYSIKWEDPKTQFLLPNFGGGGYDMTPVLLRAHRTVVVMAHRDMDGVCRDELSEMLDAFKRA